MENLEQLVKEMDETQKLADIELEAWDWRTRPSMQVAVLEARERLEKLKARYNVAISESTVGVFVFGEKASEFAALAEKESATPILVLDARQLYQRLSQGAYDSLGPSREFGVTQMGKLLSALYDVAQELKLEKPLPAPKYREAVCADAEALVDHVKSLVREAVGDDLNRTYLSREITKRALELRYTFRVLPVVIIGLADVDEAAGLEGAVARFGVRVTATDEVTKEMVIEAFTELQKKIKKNKTKNND